MSHIDREPFPRWTLIAAATLITVTIIGSATARHFRLKAQAQAETAEPAAPLAARDLTFLDTADGSVEIRDAGSGGVVFTAGPGTNGFIRGVMRGLARHRRARGVDEAPPFRLAEWPDGRLTLEDLATGKEIELSAFGADNRAAFHRLLAGETQT